MAEYDPPIYNVPIFNPAYFIDEDEITKSYLRANFLEFPIGQGLETLPDLRIENQNIHLGSFAGLASQGSSGVAIGNFAGYDTQGGGAVAIGLQAGQNSQGANSIAIGSYAGYSGGNLGEDSISIGNSSRATGVEAVSIGHNAISNGDEAVVVGHNNSGGEDAVVIGHNNTGQQDSVVLGHNNTCAENSICLGHSSTSSGENSLALGHTASTSTFNSAVAIGNGASAVVFSTALGSGSNATGNGSLSCGVNAVSSGLWSVALGRNTTASGQSSVAIGNGATASADNEIKIGTSASAYQMEGRLNLVNPNTSSIITFENFVKMYKLANGLSIGTLGEFAVNVNDTRTLTSNPLARAGINSLFLNNEGRAYLGGNKSVHLRSLNLETYITGYTTAGNVSTIGTSGQLSVSSDRRLKENIETYDEPSIDKIMKLKPSYYNWIKGTDKRKELGFIAQDVETIIPEAVDGKKHEYEWEKDEEGEPILDASGNLQFTDTPRYRGLLDRPLIAVLVKAVQEQQQEINQLKERISYLNI